MSQGYKKNVGMIGSVSLLICSITGPGIVILPLLFQESGWVMPLFIFILIGFLACLASLLIIEAITLFPNNYNLETNVEFTVLVHQFYGRKWYYVFLFILYGSLQSTNIASIVGSAQIFDSVFVGLFGATCGYGLYPINGLYCVYQVSNSNSPFGDNYMFTTLGYLIVIAAVIPLTKIDLNDNMLVQLVSVGYNFLFLFSLLIMAMVKGIDSNRMPAVGTSISQVVGQVLYNFSMNC